MNQGKERAPNFVVKLVRLECRTFQEEGKFLARCDDLRISDHGSSEGEAAENLMETIRLFFESCIRRGTIGQVLKDRGIVIQSVDSGSGTLGAPEDQVVLPMPWMVLRNSQNDGDRVH